MTTKKEEQAIDMKSNKEEEKLCEIADRILHKKFPNGTPLDRVNELNRILNNPPTVCKEHTNKIVEVFCLFDAKSKIASIAYLCGMDNEYIDQLMGASNIYEIDYIKRQMLEEIKYLSVTPDENGDEFGKKGYIDSLKVLCGELTQLKEPTFDPDCVDWTFDKIIEAKDTGVLDYDQAYDILENHIKKHRVYLDEFMCGFDTTSDILSFNPEHNELHKQDRFEELCDEFREAEKKIKDNLDAGVCPPAPQK